MIDVLDRGVEAVDDLDREHRREILGVPVFLGGIDERADARIGEHRACASTRSSTCLSRYSLPSGGSSVAATPLATSSVSIVLQVP